MVMRPHDRPRAAAAAGRLIGILCLAALPAAFAAVVDIGRGTVVIGDIPGRPPSLHYSAWVALPSRAAAAPQPAFVLETVSRNASRTHQTNGYFAHLNLWTASWLSVVAPVNELSAGPLFYIYVSRRNSSSSVSSVSRDSSTEGPAPPISRAAIHPRTAPAQVLNISSSGVVLIAVSTSPCRFTVDFDGGLDETDTGPGYSGPPQHTFSVFVNAPLPTPSPASPNVHVVAAGSPIPTNLPPNSTLLFGPGVHRTPRNPQGWRIFTLQQNVTYFLPLDAIWLSALNSGPWGASTITLLGHGVLSGEDMARTPTPVPDTAAPCFCTGEELLQGPPCCTALAGNNTSPQGLTIGGAHTAHVEGPTLVDFPNHHLILQTTSCRPSVLRSIKVLGWRSNGDGLHVFGSWNVSGLFLRTQDDSLYLHAGSAPAAGCPATVFHDITTWNDANGAAFITCGTDTRLQHSTAIYARASWAWWAGGRVFTHRTDFTDSCHNVSIDSVWVEDVRPTLNAFQLQQSQPGTSTTELSFTNVHVAAPSTVSACPGAGSSGGGGGGGGCNCVPPCRPGPLPLGIPSVIAGASPTANITNLSFNNVSVAGFPMRICLTPGSPAAGLFNLSTSTVFNITIDGNPLL